MGLQITPCTSITAPCPDRLQGRLPSVLIGTTSNCKEAALGKLPHTSANHDSCNPKSHSSCYSPPRLPNSPNSPLSDACSSLTSLPSLARSLISSRSSGAETYADSQDHRLDQQAISSAANVRISARCVCIATIKDLGDQVACDAYSDEGVFYTATSACPAPFLKTWFLHGGDVHQINNNGLPSTRARPVREVVVTGKRVFTSHDDRKIRIWERRNSRPGNALGDSSGGCEGSRVGSEHRLAAVLPTMWDCTVRALTPGGYKQERRNHRRLWIEHADTISTMAVDAQQGYLYSGSWDRSIKVWRLLDFKCVESFRAHDDAINALALSACGKFLYSAAADGKIKVWTWALPGATVQRSRHVHLVTTLQAHHSAVNALALSSDEEFLYSGACDKAIVVWDRQERAAEHALVSGVLRGHRRAVLCLAALPSSSWGNIVCSGSADKTIRLWQQVQGRLHVCLAVLHGHSAPLKRLSLTSTHPSSTNNAQLALCSAALDHTVKVWQITIGFPC